jgi:hypothetical protein
VARVEFLVSVEKSASGVAQDDPKELRLQAQCGRSQANRALLSTSPRRGAWRMGLGAQNPSLAPV